MELVDFELGLVRILRDFWLEELVEFMGRVARAGRDRIGNTGFIWFEDNAEERGDGVSGLIRSRLS